MTLFNDTNITDASNLGDIIITVNNDILSGWFGWSWLIMIFTVLYSLSRHSNNQNSLAFAAIGTTISSLLLTALGILPAYYILLCVIVLAAIVAVKFVNEQP